MDEFILSFPCEECKQPTAEPDVCQECGAFLCFPCLLDKHSCTKEEGAKIIAKMKTENKKLSKKEITSALK